MSDYVSADKLQRYHNGIKNLLNGKVDAVSGKGLSTNDFTTTEKNKLSGIASGAEVNQNAFSNVAVGSTTIQADSKTDTLTLVAGSNVTLTPNATNDSITIATSSDSPVLVCNFSLSNGNIVCDKSLTEIIAAHNSGKVVTGILGSDIIADLDVACPIEADLYSIANGEASFYKNATDFNGETSLFIKIYNDSEQDVIYIAPNILPTLTLNFRYDDGVCTLINGDYETMAQAYGVGVKLQGFVTFVATSERKAVYLSNVTEPEPGYPIFTFKALLETNGADFPIWHLNNVLIVVTEDDINLYERYFSLNEDTFYSIEVGNTTLRPDQPGDTLTLVAGQNITLTPNATNDSITISASITITESDNAAGGKTVTIGAVDSNA